MRHQILIIGMLLLAFMSSCRTDLKLAKSFVAERNDIQAAVYFPEKADVIIENNTAYGNTEA